MSNIFAMWILIICFISMFIYGVEGDNVQCKFFALGVLATLGYLLIFSFFD